MIKSLGWSIIIGYVWGRRSYSQPFSIYFFFSFYRLAPCFGCERRLSLFAYYLLTDGRTYALPQLEYFRMYSLNEKREQWLIFCLYITTCIQKRPEIKKNAGQNFLIFSESILLIYIVHKMYTELKINPRSVQLYVDWCYNFFIRKVRGLRERPFQNFIDFSLRSELENEYHRFKKIGESSPNMELWKQKYKMQKRLFYIMLNFSLNIGFLCGFKV